MKNSCFLIASEVHRENLLVSLVFEKVKLFDGLLRFNSIFENIPPLLRLEIFSFFLTNPFSFNTFGGMIEKC